MTQPVPATASTHRLLDTLVADGVPVLQACGGRGICATCHVRVTAGADQLSPKTERETKTLARISGVGANSRLACQSQVLGDGVTYALPDANYAESITDIEVLIGKRTKRPILHPSDGRVLIQAKKIITRSAIQELNNVSFNVADISYETT